MNYNAMCRRIVENGTEEQARRATEIRNRLVACWQTEAQDEADMGRLEDLYEEVQATTRRGMVDRGGPKAAERAQDAHGEATERHFDRLYEDGDLPEAFRPMTFDGGALAAAREIVDQAHGYNCALENTKAADLWRESRRLRAALERISNAEDDFIPAANFRRVAREALRGDEPHA